VIPGNFHTSHCLEPAVLAAEIALDLSPKQHKRVVWRLDGGAGSDAHLIWLFQRGYHVVAKGMNNRRAVALARQVSRWDAIQENAWVGEVPAPIDYGRKVRVFVKKRLKDNKLIYSYYVSSLSLSSKKLFMKQYDARGAAEIEQFRNDKSGLGLEARRKRNFFGQKGYILLTDLAHNLLADFYHLALVDSAFHDYGPKRIVRDILAVPGRMSFENDQLVRVDLISQMQSANTLVTCLKKYLNSN